ncbi:MAG: glycosyltransferase [Candidatus Levyibacteriota bacterium]|nr:MAG: glycosyltransferase [Candidatus Levybacteria bacterium]
MHKRIAMFSVHTCPLAFEEGKETGGMNVYVMALAQELVKIGYIVDIFTRSQSQKHKKIVNVSPRLRVVHLVAGKEKPLPKQQLLQYIDEFTNSFLAFTQKENLEFNLFHAHYYLSGKVCQKLRAIGLNIPFIMTFHTLALMKNLVARDELEREGKERIDAEITLAKEANYIIASSQTDAQYLQYLYSCDKDKITVVYPGVDAHLFLPMDKQKAKKHVGADFNHKLVLYVGRIEPLKGIDMLIYALKIILEQHPNIKVCLWIIGGDVSQKKHLWSNELQRLEKLRQLLNIETMVYFVGQKHQHELPYYYNAAELVVMPSHYESFGMAAIEAMSCGVPVITTNVSGVTDILDKRHQQLITAVNNPLLLASQIIKLLTNEEEYKKISTQIQKQVRDLSWQQISQKISRVYKKFL